MFFKKTFRSPQTTMQTSPVCHTIKLRIIGDAPGLPKELEVEMPLVEDILKLETDMVWVKRIVGANLSITSVLGLAALIMSMLRG
ncbi:MAG TPA: hypothetical protein VIH27_04120, partial [Nitrososphaerales archaeon]